MSAVVSLPMLVMRPLENVQLRYLYCSFVPFQVTSVTMWKLDWDLPFVSVVRYPYESVTTTPLGVTSNTFERGTQLSTYPSASSLQGPSGYPRSFVVSASRLTLPVPSGPTPSTDVTVPPPAGAYAYTIWANISSYMPISVAPSCASLTSMKFCPYALKTRLWIALNQLSGI